MKKLYAVIVAVFLCTVSAAAQSSFFDNYVYQQWSSLGGLTGATANDIIQTKDGFINVGTYEGLVRFDGVAFTTLKKSKGNGYSFNSVRVIMQDSLGNLWVGSNEDGVQLLSLKDGNVEFTTQSGLPNNSIRAVVEDKKGNVWVGTAAGVVYLTKEKHLLNPQFEAGSVPEGVVTKDLFCDTAGRVWLVTENEKGLFVFQDGLFRTITSLDSLGSYGVSAIGQDLQGNFWIGLRAGGGLVKIENGVAVKVSTNSILDSVEIHAIYTAKDGTVWFGTTSGVVVMSNGAFYEYKNRMLKDVKISKIICDREGNIWLATDNNGIGKLTHGRFKMTKTNFASNAIAEGKDGRIWIGTDRGVLCYINDRPEKNVLTDYTKGIRIRHIEIAANGDVLVSCYSKLGQLRYYVNGSKEGTVDSWTTEEGLAGEKVRVAIESEPGELYVGTTSGLSIIHKDGSIKNFRRFDGLENDYIMCLYKDKNDVVWVGTDGGGVFLMKDERILGNITPDNGLVGNVVFKITQDKDDSYWICTGKGLTRCPSYDSSKEKIPEYFQVITEDHGLETDAVFQIIPDKTGDVWFTSNYGIASVPYKELIDVAEENAESLSVKFYNKNDGLDSDGTTSTALSICDHYGRLWFTMIDGFAVYDPVKVHENPVMPLVCIESITVDSVEYANPTSVIELKPGTKRVDVKFTGLSFDAPERIQFVHRLTGFEDDFSDPDYNRTISYTNLKPGKHLFIVSAINGDGLASDSAETMLLVQEPYFYQTYWFWILVGVIFLGTLYSIFHLKELSIKRENIRLDGLVKERTRQLAVEKEKSDQLLHAILPDKIAKELKDNVHSMGENFSDVTILFSDIVNFTKTSSEHSALEIVLALNDLVSRFDERAKRMGVEKIKTIGDAYMAACGLPAPNKDHAKIMIEFAKGMYEDLREYNKTSFLKFNIRIGLNCGPVNAGVIGKTKFVYDVWGNTVNVASRMESACSPGGIRVSENAYEHLKDCDIKFSEPIECNVKGKGMMTTYEVVMEMSDES
ncbi:MAG: hypothetical protein K6G00_04055 [Treponema sp.]|nr:hypothetical protein [Treponema sp.]